MKFVKSFSAPRNVLSKVALLMLLGFYSSFGNAVLTVVLEEQGADVVMTASGTVNLAALGAPSNASCSSGINAFTGLAVAGGSSVACDVYSIPSPSPSPRPGFGGSVDSVVFTASGSGIAGIAGTANSPTVTVPRGYVSGASLNASSVFSGTDFSTLEVVPGTYTVSWGAGSDADSVVVEIRATSQASNAEPVPALPGFLLYGLVVLMGLLASPKLRLKGFKG